MSGSHGAPEPSLFKDTHLGARSPGTKGSNSFGHRLQVQAWPAGLTGGRQMHSGSEAQSIFSFLGLLKDVLPSPLGHPLSSPQREDSSSWLCLDHSNYFPEAFPSVILQVNTNT